MSAEERLHNVTISMFMTETYEPQRKRESGKNGRKKREAVGLDETELQKQPKTEKQKRYFNFLEEKTKRRIKKTITVK